MDFSQERSLTYLRAVAQLQHDEIVRLKQQVADLTARLGATSPLAEENTRLADLLALREHALFGKSTERRTGTTAKLPKEPAVPAKGHGPREQPELERVPVEHLLPEDQRQCPCCGGERVELDGLVEETELISVTPRSFVIEVHRRHKYRCACDERQPGSDAGPVVTAPGPLRLVKGGRYSVAFAIEVAVAKYADHLPLERQVQIMKREGLRIDSQTLWDQLDALAKHLEPTYEGILAAILTHPVIHADETRWELLDNGKTKENKTFQAWGLVAPELVGYRILDSRSKQAAASVLGDYQGVVMADAYTAYTSLAAGLKKAGQKGFEVANCWAHARRKFVECQKNEPEHTAKALDFIRDLYHIEKRATPETHASLRDTESRKLVSALFDWARELRPAILPRSGLGEALGYLLNQETGLTRFLEDPRIPLDNNACERALRGVVLGRKNHYGSRSRRGTEVAAILYTLMESAKLAEVSPRAYLRAVVDLAIQTPGAVLTPASFKASLPPATE